MSYTDDMTSELTIGKLAERTEVQPRTIRFYEAKGLLPPPRRSGSGYRLYSAQDVRRLSLVRAARSLGFSIREVRHLMAAAQHEGCASFQGQVAQLIVAKLQEVDETMQQLMSLRNGLREVLGSLEEPEGGCEGSVLDRDGCHCLGQPRNNPSEGRR
jgi:DNA-binding transcriptional MerR regulator